MPIYLAECPTCGRQEDVYRPVEQYRQMPDCCGQMMEKRITAPHVIGDIAPFRSVVDGSVINSRSDRREHMRKHNLVEVGNEPIRKQEYRGEHNVRPELTQAVKQVLRK